jgi:hypothetical protein
MPESKLTYRVAVVDDETDILPVFKEVAPEVPTVAGPNTEPIIHECVVSGDSWVAVDEAGLVVGFALAKPDRIERDRQKNKAVSLRYIGVTGAVRGQGACSDLIEKLKSKGGPLTAEVLHSNKSSMADRFAHYGFDKGEADEKSTKFRWEKKAAPAI